MSERKVHGRPMVSIEDVGLRQFLSAKSQYQDAKSVPQAGLTQEPWRKITLDEALLNEGAGVCAIAVVFGWDANVCISGHFPIIDKNSDDDVRSMLARNTTSPKEGDRLKIASPMDVWHLQPYIADVVIPEIRDYLSFLKEIEHLASISGNYGLEAYLFGQNLEDQVQFVGLAQSLILYNKLLMDMKSAGVKPDKIFDLRRSFARFGVENVLCLPQEKRIVCYNTRNR